MTTPLPNLLYLILAWLLYFALHSASASLTVKRHIAACWPQFAAYYRIFYNVLAVVTLIPPLWLLEISRGDWLWTWQGAWGWAANGLALAAVVGFWWSLRYYDTREFLGLRQTQVPEGRQRFALSPLHRYVRHPWYFFALVIIWTRDIDPAWLVSCVAITLYFAVGSYWEEQKLIAEFGEPYRRYRRRVPGLVPLPGRYLTRAEAAEIVEAANRTEADKTPG